MKFSRLIIGIGAGVIAGMLLAPKKGKDIRDDIKKETKKAYESIKNLSREDIEAVLGETIESVRQAIDEFDVEELRDTTKEKLSELQEKLETFSNRLKETDQYEKMKDKIVDLSDSINSKIDEFKSKGSGTDLKEEDLENIEEEIDAVEKKLDEMIEEIKD